MFLPGDYFTGRVLGDEIEFEIVATLTYDNDDYVIAESSDGEKYVFLANDEEDLEYIDDEDQVEEILEYWEEEYGDDKEDIGDWEDDEYYDREDTRNSRERFDNEDYHDEEDY
ncbi:DUF1292 domain-containing protein [Fusobacterium perfoetens]|uniref:DUF1292 domain-containing protein n=1 Tax=Fusobacterium perfoetens TaxID=852 RepID=UPI0004873F38|nr:DUF1292 domain-containing protein [Fusobacterium perfoetens]MCI6152888.1 DUF1292 domain-containing protein [Fusobacterium perfoetens]MDY3237300.1 DUF1292 domain-containing protein [Fusobacterium perfoetens]